MIAVYYVQNSSPKHLYVIEVENDDYDDFLKALQKEEYPFPDSEVIFIENEEVVNSIGP